MLILTRRPGETLRIGDHVEVTVLGVKGNQVRVGVKAPRDVVVDREEIAELKAAERLEGPKTCRTCNRKDCICREARARTHREARP